MVVNHARLLARIAELLGGDVRVLEDLGGSDRSRVWRLTVGDGTVIAKWFARSDAGTNSGGYGLVREYAGLRVIPETPELVAADLDLGLVIMTDLGSGPTLADALLGDDPDLAGRRCAEWANAMGRLCAGSRAVGDFAELLRACDPDTRLAGGMPSPNLVAEGLQRLADAGLAIPASVELERRGFERLVHPEADAAVVTPGDFCPDNVIFTDGGPRFVDLEGSSIHHVAFDAAYAVMPFGTCWCLFDAPRDFTGLLDRAFRRGAEPELSPVLDADAWPMLVQLACAYTALMMTELSWAAAHNDHVDIPEGLTTPRQRLVARWRWAAANLSLLPGLGSLFAVAVDLAHRQWSPGSLTWPRYPAFADE